MKTAPNELRHPLSGNRIAAALARRIESTWEAYEAARASHGVAGALPLLRRWHALRETLGCYLTGASLLVLLPADPEPIHLGHEECHEIVLESAMRHIRRARAMTPPPGQVAIKIPSILAERLRHLCFAAGYQGGGDAFVTSVIGTCVHDAATSTPRRLAGAADLLFHATAPPPRARGKLRRDLLAAATGWKGGWQ